MDYKKTLNMPQTTFEMRANLVQKAPEWERRWRDEDLYQKVLAKNKDHRPFFLHDGPPYANGNIHVGHALNKVLKDFILRSHAMMGDYTLYIPGWDTHGLPIESAILKKNREIAHLPPPELRAKCKEYALEQVEIQKRQFEKLGLLCDFKQIYLTLDHDFEIQQLKLFSDMVHKNLIFRAYKPIYWSWSSHSALAEAEIEYADQESDSIYLTFDLVDDAGKLLVWTTTPWTIPANLAIAVHPDLTYAKIRVDGNVYIVAENLIPSLSEKFGWKGVEVLETFPGRKMEGWQYHHPYLDRVSPVILAQYVSAKDGTGLVHNAPGFGADDYLACKAYGIGIYCPIDEHGKFTAEVDDAELNGKFYLDTNPIIIDRLKKGGHLLAHEKIIHSAAHDWRTKKPVMYRSTKQWFVNLEKIQDELRTTLERDVSSPNPRALERLRDTVGNRIEWCISRQRAWGVPIPMVFAEDGEPIIDPELTDYIIDVLDKNGVDRWFEWEVEKFLPEKYRGRNLTKETDIMDVWFDSGSSHDMFAIWGQPYPATLYLEGNDQFRGWFNSSLITGVVKHGRAPYEQIVTHGFVMDENGFKMSKSRGNVVDPLRVCETYGADIFRLWIASCDYWEDQRIGDHVLGQMNELYRKLRNTLFRYPLANLNGFTPVVDSTTDFMMEDRFILDALHTLLVDADAAYRRFDFSAVVRMVSDFTLMLSTWYFDLIKDPLYCNRPDDHRVRQIQTTLFTIVDQMMRLMAPILPQTMDEFYQAMPNRRRDSIHLEDWITLEPFVEFTEGDVFETFFNLKDVVYAKLEALRASGEIKKNNEARVTMRENPTPLDVETLARWLMVADVVIDPDQGERVTVANSGWQKCARCWECHEHLNGEICERCVAVLAHQK